MRILKKTLITIILVLIILYGAVYLFIALRGRVIIINKFQELTQKKVSIGSLSISPPFNLELKNINIEGLGKAENVFLSPSIPYLVTGNVALNNVKILRPEITYERKPLDSSTAETPKETAKITLAEPKKKWRSPLILKRINIRDGKINFIDYTIGTPGIVIVVKNINFNLINTYTFPVSVITNFDFNGKIPWKEGQIEGKVKAEGWINFLKKDMQATLNIEDIDGVYLYPYYANWVDLEKARIESAKLNLTSNIHGLNNNVTAECHLELTDIVRRSRSQDEPEEKAERIANAVLDIFRAFNQGKIVLDFTIRTKMDRPEFGLGTIKMAFEDKLAKARPSNTIKAEDVTMLPGKLLEGFVKGATGFSKAVIDGTFAVGNEIKKSVEETFKKEPEEDRH